MDSLLSVIVRYVQWYVLQQSYLVTYSPRCGQSSDFQTTHSLFSQRHLRAKIFRACRTNQIGTLYFAGKNFIAQSCVIRTLVSFKALKHAVLAMSCLTLLSWWAFQEWIALTAWLCVYNKSSSSSGASFDSAKYHSIQQRTSLILSHCEHLRLWSWEQLDLSSLSLLLLRAWPLQWSATKDPSDTCTFENKRVTIFSYMYC